MTWGNVHWERVALRYGHAVRHPAWQNVCFMKESRVPPQRMSLTAIAHQKERPLERPRRHI